MCDRRVFRDVTNSGDLNETRRYLYTPAKPGGNISIGEGGLLNCADDAIDICNKKHPEANAAYELCIKAQLGHKCPKGTATPHWIFELE